MLSFRTFVYFFLKVLCDLFKNQLKEQTVMSQSDKKLT